MYIYILYIYIFKITKIHQKPFQVNLKVKLWLVNRKDGTAKWHEFRIVYRLAKRVTDAMIIGSKFMDKHLIYRGVDERDLRIKIFRVEINYPDIYKRLTYSVVKEKDMSFIKQIIELSLKDKETNNLKDGE